MTEETPQTGGETQVTTQQTEQNAGNITTEAGKTKEQGKKEKCRPMTKVVIRRLPPSMAEEQFLEQVSPLPDYDYMYFAKADMSLGQYAFSRAYIDFVNQDDIFGFREKFDNYVFVDAKGIEFPAVVEFAPFQRVPKKRIGKKKDPKCATIETDPYYISFLESLKTQETDPANAQPKTEYSFQPSDHAPKKVTSTPLLDFLKQRKQEKQRIRDEKREEKRRRDIERKRGKEEPIISKVLKNVEEKDRDREPSRENKENKEDKEKILQKDFKNRNKKEDRYRDKMVKDRDIKTPAKNFRDREDRVREKDIIKQTKKHEDKKFINRKDDRENCSKEDKTYDKDEITYSEKRTEEKRGKSYEKMRQEKKRLAETQKKSNAESVQGDSDEDHDVDDGEENIDDRTGRRNSTERNNVGNKFKYKNRRNDDSPKFDTEESTEMTKKSDKKEINSLNTDEAVLSSELQEKCERLTLNSGSKDDTRKDVTEKKSPRIAKRRSSLESGKESGTGSKNSGGGGSGGEGNGDGSSKDSCLRRHKSLDGGDDSNLQKSESDEKDKDKKDPRMERRIRNKDRPAMEIYRPGMGRFSKQRMQEREKGTEEKTPSQSPTPTSGNNFKSNKQSVSEVRSMTFKRSVSRDVS